MASRKVRGETGRLAKARRLARRRSTKLSLEVLEDRCMLSVTVGTNITGLKFGDDSRGYVPPDTDAAAGTTHIVETVNTIMAVYNKSDGSLVAKQSLGSFFGTSDSLSDPVVTYDEQAGKFFLATL